MPSYSNPCSNMIYSLVPPIKMKKLKLTILLLSLVLCTPLPLFSQQQTTLEVAITQPLRYAYPDNIITTTFVGTISGALKPIAVTMEWFVKDVRYHNSTLFSKNEFIFRETTPTKLIIYLTLNVYIPSGDYWLRLTWTDDKGLKTIQTNKIFCNTTKY